MPTSNLNTTAVIAPFENNWDIPTFASIQPDIPFGPATPVFGPLILQEVLNVYGSYATITFAEDIPAGAAIFIVAFFNSMFYPIGGVGDSAGNSYSYQDFIGPQGADLNGEYAFVNPNSPAPPVGGPGSLGIAIFTAINKRNMVANSDFFSLTAVNEAQIVLIGTYFTDVPRVTLTDYAFANYGNDTLLVNNPFSSAELIDSGPTLARTNSCIVVGAMMNVAPATDSTPIFSSGTSPFNLVAQAESSQLTGHYISSSYEIFAGSSGPPVVPPLFSTVTIHYFDITWVVAGFLIANQGDQLRINSGGQAQSQWQAVVAQFSVPQGANPLEVQTNGSISTPFGHDFVSTSGVVTITHTSMVSSSAITGVSTLVTGKSLDVDTLAIIE